MGSNISTDITMLDKWYHILILCHHVIIGFQCITSCMMSCFDVIIWCHRLWIGCHAMKSIHEIIHMNRICARTLARCCFWGVAVSNLFQIRGWAPYLPLLSWILRLLLLLRPHRAAPCLGSGTHFRVQSVPGRDPPLEEGLISFAIDGIERGQARFHVLFRKSLDAIVTVAAIVGGRNHKSDNVGDEGLW